jgi:pimeloyl-ACP methyl ester carboxylesterase
MRLPSALGFVAALLVHAASAVAAPDTGKDVVLKADDNGKIAATWWGPIGAESGGVVLVHAEESDRWAWKPVVPYLRARGLQVVAVDLRGHGRSAKPGNVDLATRAQQKDPKVWGETWRDVLVAARHLVKQGKCEPKKVVFVGVGAGAWSALDAAGRAPTEVGGVLVVSPPAAFPGFDDAAIAKAYPAGAPLLVVGGKDDAAAKALAGAVAGSRLLVADDAKKATGMALFGAMPLFEQTVAGFAAATTGSKEDVVLDGCVEDAGDLRAWTQATKVGQKGLDAWAYRVGRRVEFGGRVRGEKSWLFVGVYCQFAPGTFPGVTEDPKLGLPEVAAVELETRKWSWIAPFDFGKGKGMGVHDVASRPRPALRVVPTSDGFSFEGEWITEYGDGPSGPVDPARVAVYVEALEEAPEKPKTPPSGGIILMTNWTTKAAEVPSR